MRYGLVAIMLIVATSASAFEGKAFLMRDDFDAEPLYDCALQDYYHIPCPTYSWFWLLSGWERGDIVGTWFTVGDNSTGGYETCDPGACMVLESFVYSTLVATALSIPGTTLSSLKSGVLMNMAAR